MLIDANKKKDPFDEFLYNHSGDNRREDMVSEADDALRRSELRLRQITDNMMDSICTINENGIFEYVSPSHKSILGFDPEEMVGKQNIHLLHPDDRFRVAQYVQRLIANQSIGKIEYRAIHKDGHYVWMESVGQVYIDDYSGNKQIVVVTRDITERKQVEDVLLKSEENLRNKVNYLNTLINNMNELCYTVDRDHRLTFGNQKAFDVTGYSMKEGLGKLIYDLIPSHQKEKVMNEIRGRFEEGRTSIYEHNIICKNGNELLLKIKSSPIVENGEITGSLVLAEDITQQRKLEKEMARLGQLNTVGEMAASIGHEIRNPMTTVQGFLQIMKQEEDFKDHHAHFDLMLEELGRANSIITEFLALAKDKVVNLQCYNLNNIILTLAPLLMADAINRDKNIRFELGNIPDLLLDENELRQLILNLTRNGLEAMVQGGLLTIKTCHVGDEVILSVQDEGKGIPPEIMDKLGTPFLSTKESGTGLGLAVCYSIVARHQAKLSVETSDHGSTFDVHFHTTIKSSQTKIGSGHSLVNLL